MAAAELGGRVIQVTKMWVRSFSLDWLVLHWEIGNVPGPRNDAERHEIFDYEFFILRAGDSPMGPYEQVGGPLIDQYSFRDVSVSLMHKWRQYFYKLRIVDRRTGESVETEDVGSVASPPDLIAMEIMRQEDVLFREFVGRRCWLFPIRTFGPRCSCYDMTLGRITRSNHAPCFGTGFLGGFMSPVEVFIQIDPNPRQSNSTSLQEVQPSDTVGRMISFPPVNPHDILIETENRRWRVLSVTTTERLRAMVRQELRLHEIPRGDIEYALPVRIDERAHVAASERNFKNAQNLENDGDHAALLAFYNYPRRSS